MSIDSVSSRINAIESRIASIAVMGRPTAPTAPYASGPAASTFAAELSRAQDTGALSASTRMKPTGATFAAVDRPALPTTGALSDVQLRDVLAEAGFEGEALRTAWALARRESGGRPDAESPSNTNGTRDHGLFQINDVHRGSWIDFDRLSDPLYNAQVAYRMSDGGKDFSAWALGSTGWAGHLQETAPDTYQMLHGRFMEQYQKYPF